MRNKPRHYDDRGHLIPTWVVAHRAKQLGVDILYPNTRDYTQLRAEYRKQLLAEIAQAEAARVAKAIIRKRSKKLL